MVIERKIVTQYYTSDPKVEVTAQLELDVDSIIQDMANKAQRNRSKKSTNLGGAIKCRVYPIEKK